MFTEKRACYKPIYRQLCGAAHERQQQYCHAAVALVIHCARAHCRGNGAAEAHQQRYEAFSAQPEAAHGLIHYKRYAAHIAAVLKQAETKEKQRYLRQEREHAANALYYAVANKAYEPLSRARVLQQAHHGGGNGAVYEFAHKVA